MTLDQIITAVTSHYDVTPQAIASKLRTQCVSKPRQVIMYLARKHTKLSFSYIGNRLGKRDHTTVMFGAATVSRLIDSDPQLALDVLAFERKLGV